MNSFSERNLNVEKKYLYNKYAALNIIMTNTTKERWYGFYVSTPDKQLFDIYSNKTRETSIKITFKNNEFTR